MTENLNMYKKSGLILMNMARDLFLAEPDEQIPTIYDYTQRFSVSRGIVQSAIERLQEDGGIGLEKRGVKGTFLRQRDFSKLHPFTGWSAVTGTMPVPLNPLLTSLATGICQVMNKAPFPFSFAYVSGSEKRLEALERGIYDFIVLSKSAAQLYLERDPELVLCAELPGSVYSLGYVVYFTDTGKHAIEDGMRVGIDPTCLDQKVLTERLCAGKKVELVEFPFIGFEDLVRDSRVDCVVYRSVGWKGGPELTPLLREEALPEVPGFSEEETVTPVILVRKENYGMDRLLRKYMDTAAVRQIQKQVLDGSRAMKFY